MTGKRVKLTKYDVIFSRPYRDGVIACEMKILHEAFRLAALQAAHHIWEAAEHARSVVATSQTQEVAQSRVSKGNRLLERYAESHPVLEKAEFLMQPIAA